ncbi:MAG: hypothetical protein RLZZ427_250, partial [Pseudomonadota bacterium]
MRWVKMRGFCAMAIFAALMRASGYGGAMRPDRLNPLFVSADSLKGVGPG